MNPVLDRPLHELQRHSLQSQIRLMRRAIEDAIYELWEGRLDYREAERLAEEVRIVSERARSLEKSLSGS